MRHRKTELFVLIASAAMGAWFGLAMEENHQRQVAGLYSADFPVCTTITPAPLQPRVNGKNVYPRRKDLA